MFKKLFGFLGGPEPKKKRKKPKAKPEKEVPPPPAMQARAPEPQPEAYEEPQAAQISPQDNRFYGFDTSASEETPPPQESPHAAREVIDQLAHISSVMYEEKPAEEFDEEEYYEEPYHRAQLDELVEEEPEYDPNTVHLSVRALLPVFAADTLSAELDTLAAQFGDVNVPFDRAEIVSGLATGRVEVQVGDLVRRMPYELFNDSINDVAGDLAELPLGELVCKVPPAWFELGLVQNNSKELLIEDMEDLFRDLPDGAVIETPPEEEEYEEYEDIADEQTVRTSVQEAPPSYRPPADTFGDIEPEEPTISHREVPAPRLPDMGRGGFPSPAQDGQRDVPTLDDSDPNLQVPWEQDDGDFPEWEEPEAPAPAPVQFQVPVADSFGAAPTLEEDSGFDDSSIDLPPPRALHRPSPVVPENLPAPPPLPPAPTPALDEVEGLAPPAPLRAPVPLGPPLGAGMPSASDDLGLPPPPAPVPREPLAPPVLPAPPAPVRKPIAESAVAAPAALAEPTPFNGPDHEISTQDTLELRSVAHDYFGESVARRNELIRDGQTDKEKVDHSVLWASRAPYGVDVNTATEPELSRLAGVGPHIAAAIVAHRDAQGRFARVQDLMDVAGLGAHTYRTMTCMSASRDLRATELAVNEAFGVPSEEISLAQLAAVARAQIGLDGVIIADANGDVIAKDVPARLESLVEGLCGAGPQLHRRGAKALKQSRLPAADMFTFYLEQHAVTFAGHDHMFMVCIHEGSVPNQAQLKQCRRLANELAWYCADRAIV